MNENPGTVKECPLCHASFTCNPIGCWCAALPPVMPMIPGADCYCPQCLNSIIAEKLATHTD